MSDVRPYSLCFDCLRLGCSAFVCNIDDNDRVVESFKLSIVGKDYKNRTWPDRFGDRKEAQKHTRAYGVLSSSLLVIGTMNAVGVVR